MLKRVAVIVLSVWVLFSGNAWAHSRANQINNVAVGAALFFFGAIAIRHDWARYVTLGLGAWLLFFAACGLSGGSEPRSVDNTLAAVGQAGGRCGGPAIAYRPAPRAASVTSRPGRPKRPARRSSRSKVLVACTACSLGALAGDQHGLNLLDAMVCSVSAPNGRQSERASAVDANQTKALLKQAQAFEERAEWAKACEIYETLLRTERETGHEKSDERETG